MIDSEAYNIVKDYVTEYWSGNASSDGEACYYGSEELQGLVQLQTAQNYAARAYIELQIRDKQYRSSPTYGNRLSSKQLQWIKQRKKQTPFDDNIEEYIRDVRDRYDIKEEPIERKDYIPPDDKNYMYQELSEIIGSEYAMDYYLYILNMNDECGKDWDPQEWLAAHGIQAVIDKDRVYGTR